MVSTLQPPDSLADEGRLSETAYDRYVRPNLRPEHDGQFVALDIDSGQYEMNHSDLLASDRLLDRLPDARCWLFRVGQPATYRTGFLVEGIEE